MEKKFIQVGLIVIIALSLTMDPVLCRRNRKRDKNRKESLGEEQADEGTPDFNDEAMQVIDSQSFDMGSHAQCVDIPSNVNLCKGIGYTQMRLPNLLHHETLDEVAQQAGQWIPLVSTKCHPDTQLFLCSLFSPVCLGQPIYPCRSLCEIVKQGCEPKMLAYGFPWPNMLTCDKFPTDDQLCIAAQHAPKDSNATFSSLPPEGIKACPACKSVANQAEMKEMYCQSDFVAKLKMADTVLVGDELRMTSRKKTKFYKSPKHLNTNKKRQAFYLQQATHCECHDLASFKQTDNKAQYLVMGKVGPEDEMLLSTYILKYERTDKTVRRILRRLKQETCERGRTEAARRGERQEGTGGPDEIKTSRKDRNKNKKKVTRKEEKKRERNEERKLKRRKKLGAVADIDDNWMIDNKGNEGGKNERKGKKERKMERINKREERIKRRQDRRDRRQSKDHQRK